MFMQIGDVKYCVNLDAYLLAYDRLAVEMGLGAVIFDFKGNWM